MHVFLAVSGLLLCYGATNGLAHAQGQSIERRFEATFAKDAKPRKSGGLAGSEGAVKRKLMFLADWQGGCGAMYKRYVAASGHSAFAATTVDYFGGGASSAARVTTRDRRGVPKPWPWPSARKRANATRSTRWEPASSTRPNSRAYRAPSRASTRLGMPISRMTSS